ncbi:RDD family protein [Microbulbifer thermotolerans]|uniref:Preprotein translocase subunit SecF n=1 Tax=Microbulbifer thermotolerans TaxID=252514 RepID=A0A143HMU8_MICTH|nr:RDD family protein [Microbulbifer thermotolerans]AMX03054.1 preprotein translocase subunit SecF [Microbulbifer thermotolerans]MCX2779020.1 RDD family protein [Microbulbifer thermotolerans]MCX2781469.1 RDD family protein [Microbulbifer thermotolerans]MCX2795708.1 RDD family protein [Microbulbifer thermotolerans]MCX2802050.1 RDD family protein [Microbulbifer thermotolerans]
MTNSATPKTFSQLPRAGVGRRLAALVYDALIVAGLLMVYGLLVVPLSSTLGLLECLPDQRCVGTPLYHTLFPLGMAAVVASYFIWSWRAAGQTIGMRAWRLLLASPGGVQLSWRQCTLRVLMAPLSVACLGLGYFWAWTRTDRASWHDLISASEVRLLPKPKKGR